MNVFQMEQETPNTALHRLGTSIDSVLTAKEAIQATGLDWDIELKDTHFQTPAGDLKTVENQFAVVRQDTQEALGVVGSRYRVVQNRDAFQFMDNIVDSGEAKYESGGELNGGKRIYIMMNVDRALEIEGDSILPYMLLVNSHDGSSSLQVMMMPVRLSCMNMIRYNMTKNYTNSIRISHTKSIDQKITEARDALGIANRYFDAFSQDVNKLITQEIDNDNFWKVVKDIMPEPYIAKDADEALVATYERQMANRDRQFAKIAKLWNLEANNNGANKWTALNAINSYELWDKPTGKTLEAKYERQANAVLKEDSKLTSKARFALEGV